jgi:hypothetical protein
VRPAGIGTPSMCKWNAIMWIIKMINFNLFRLAHIVTLCRKWQMEFAQRDSISDFISPKWIGSIHSTWMTKKRAETIFHRQIFGL